MNAPDALLERLRTHVALFEDFAADEVRQFVSLSRVRATKAGEVVIQEGERGRTMYIILAGEFEVYSHLATGPWQLLARLMPGETFGELALVDSDPRSASIISTGTGTLFEFDRMDIDKLDGSQAKLYRNLARIVSSRLRQTDRMISLSMTTEAGTPMMPTS